VTVLFAEKPADFTTQNTTTSIQVDLNTWNFTFHITCLFWGG